MSTAAGQYENDDSHTPLPLRRDTFLGVFEAIGQDLGINPNWLRVPFAALILWNPEVIVGLYLALGLVVAATRWFSPPRANRAHTALRRAKRVPRSSIERCRKTAWPPEAVIRAGESRAPDAVNPAGLTRRGSHTSDPKVRSTR